MGRNKSTSLKNLVLQFSTLKSSENRNAHTIQLISWTLSIIFLQVLWNASPLRVQVDTKCWRVFQTPSPQGGTRSLTNSTMDDSYPSTTADPQSNSVIMPEGHISVLGWCFGSTVNTSSTEKKRCIAAMRERKDQTEQKQNRNKTSIVAHDLRNWQGQRKTTGARSETSEEPRFDLLIHGRNQPASSRRHWLEEGERKP